MKRLLKLFNYITNKRAFFLSLYALATLAILLVSVEAALRTRIFKLKYSIKANNEIELDHRYLYRISPNSSNEINNMGYRDHLEFRPGKSARKRIAFLGDSFIYGMDIRSDKTVPKQLEKMLGDEYEVFNMGVYGYGPDQSLMQALHEVPSIKPDLVILSIFAANDFSDIIKNRLFRLDKNGALRYNQDNIVSREIGALRLPYLIRYLRYKKSPNDSEDQGLKDLFWLLMQDGGCDYDLIENPTSKESSDKTTLMTGILREFKATLQKQGISLVVLVMPSKNNIQNHANFNQRGIPPDKFFFIEDLVIWICSRLGISYIDLADYYLKMLENNYLKMMENDFIFDELYHGHLTDYGAEKAAQSIKAHLIKTGQLP